MDTSTPRSPTVADNVAASPVPVDDRIARKVLNLKLSGAEGEQRYSISNPRRCTCVQSPRLVYTVPLITELYQITVVSHSVHILTYCGASARSSSDLVLLHSTMQVLTR